VLADKAAAGVRCCCWWWWLVLLLLVLGSSRAAGPAGSPTAAAACTTTELNAKETHLPADVLESLMELCPQYPRYQELLQQRRQEQAGGCAPAAAEAAAVEACEDLPLLPRRCLSGSWCRAAAWSGRRRWSSLPRCCCCCCSDSLGPAKLQCVVCLALCHPNLVLIMSR